MAINQNSMWKYNHNVIGCLLYMILTPHHLHVYQEYFKITCLPLNDYCNFHNSLCKADVVSITGSCVSHVHV